MNAIKEGVNFIIPLNILKLMTWEEIETRACGEKTIEVDALKKISTYRVSLAHNSFA